MAKRARVVRYRVSRGRVRMWDVFEVGVPTPIASFHKRAEATAYARRLAASRDGAEVQIEEQAATSPAL